MATIRARFDTLGDLLRDIALRAGLRFRVVQVDGKLQFQVFEVADRSAEVRLDMRNRAIVAQKVAITAPDMTRVIVAGQGEGELRTLLEVSTADSVTAESEWGRRIETFKDQRQTNDTGELEAAATDDLTVDGATRVTMGAIPADETTMIYGTDWSLGDIVTAVIEGVETVSTVTEAKIVAGPGGARIGFSLGDSLLLDTGRALTAAVDATADRVSALERTIASAPKSTNIADATAVGRALLTAASTSAARSTIEAAAAAHNHDAAYAPMAHTHTQSGLPWLTIGVTAPAVPAEGDVWLDVSGASTVVKVYISGVWK